MKYLFIIILLFLTNLFGAYATPPGIRVDITSTTQAKEGTPAINGVFTITLDAASATPLTVFYNLTGTTAASPADYSLVAGTNVSGLTATQFVIAAGVTTATIQVVAVNNFTFNVVIPTVMMTITPDAPNYHTVIDNATINILDDDNLFTVTSAGSPTENGVTGTYTFTRATSTVGAITVNFSVGGTATLTTHYTVSSTDAFTYNPTAGTITIPAAANSATLTITPINDMMINAARTVIVTLVSSVIPDYTISNVNNSATLTIADMPLANISVATGTNAKEGTPAINGVLNFTLTQPAPIGGLTVNYALSGTAALTTNYTLTAGTNASAVTATSFIIAAGQTAATINLIPINDFTFNATRTAILTIAANANYILGTAATTTNIADDDNLFTVTSAGSPTENGATGTYTFTRATSTVGAITVNFSVGGTATFTTHYSVAGATTYTATTGTIVIPAAANSATLTITPTNDMAVNAARTVILTVVPSAIPNYTISNVNNSATLSIADFVITQIATISAGITAVEGTPTVNGTFNIALTDPAQVGGLVVQYALSGTAISPTHYTLVAGTNVSAVTATTFTIAAGATSATLSIVPINDYLINTARTATITLTATPSYNLGGTGIATININDDSNTFSIIAAGSPTEDGATGTFTITRINTTGAVAVNFTVAGSAVFPTKYTVSSLSPLTFNAGSGTAVMTMGQSSVVITVTPINDLIINVPRNIVLTLGAGTPPAYTIASPPNNSATLTIADAITPTISLASSGTPAENAGNGTFTFQRTGSTALALTVDFDLTGTAIANTNYSITGAVFVAGNTWRTTIAALQSNSIVTITPINDFVANAPRTVIATTIATIPASYNIAAAPNDSRTLSIGDDSNPITLVSSASVAGGNTGTYTFTRVNTVGDLFVYFNTSLLSGTPTYTTSSSSVFAFTPNVGGFIKIANGNTTAILNIDANAGTTIGSINITLTPAPIPNYTIGTTAAQVMNITTASTTSVIVTATTPATEGGAGATISFTRNSASAFPFPVTVNFSISTMGSVNYSLTPAGFSVVIPAGGLTQTTTVNLDALEDNIVNGSRSVIVTINSATFTFSSFTIPLSGSPNSATIGVNDSGRQISVIGSANATESGTPASFTFTRTGDNTMPQTINFTLGGTATNITDYTLSGGSVNIMGMSGTVIIPALSNSVIVTLTPNNNLALNAAKTVQITLNSGTLPDIAVALAPANTATVTIDDDPNIIDISVAATPIASEVGNTSGSFVIKRLSANTLPVSINFTIDGTVLPAAVLTTHYTASSPTVGVVLSYSGGGGSITIPANATEVILSITPVNDFTSNPDRNLRLVLTESPTMPLPRPYRLSGTLPNSATMVILDDANTVSITKIGADATKSGSVVGKFRITRTQFMGRPDLTVNFNVTGTAALNTNYTQAGANFTMGTGTVVIPANTASVDIDITAINDWAINANKTLNLALTNGQYIVPMINNSALMNIVDDNNFVSVATTGNAFEAGATGTPTPTTFTFTRTNGVNTSPLLVTFSIAGTATVLTDYNLSAIGGVTLNGANTQGTVIIAAGDNSVVVTLTPIYNVQINLNRSVLFTVIQRPTQNYTIATAPANSAGILIIDDRNTVSVTSSGNAAEVGAGGLPVATTFTFSRTNTDAGNSRPLTVDFNIGGTATALVHYNLTVPMTSTITYSATAGSVLIPAGSASVVIILTPINDSITNANRDVIFAIAQTTPQSYLINTPPNNASRIFIIDNNNTVSVSAGASAREADLGTGAVVPTTFTFSRTGGNIILPLTVNFSMSGTATITTNYTLSANVIISGMQGSVIIPANASNVVVTLTPVNDSLVNTNRDVVFTISQTSPATYTVAAANTATITIIDNNNIVGVTSSGINALEADLITGFPVPTIFTFSRSGGSIALPLTVNFSIAGAAIANTHYTLGAIGGVTFNGANTQGTVRIPANESNIIVTLTPKNDSIININRDVIFTVAASPKYTVSTPIGTSATAIIVDDKNTILIASSAVDAFESGTDGNPVATTYTFSRVGGSTGLALPILFTIGGTATAGTHYTLAATGGVVINGTNTEGTVTIPVGATSVVVTLTPINDYAASGNRTVIFTVSPKPTPTYVIGTTNIATKNIIDDTNDVKVTSAGTPSETPTSGTFTFTRSVAKTTPLTVNFTVAGTAIFPTNYTITGAATYLAGSGTVIIPANATSVTITINPINDFVANSPRTIILTVIHTTPAKTYVVAPAPDNQSSIAILDDANPIKITQTGIATESGTTAKFTISKTNPTTNDITVSFNINTLSLNSAIFGTNYTVIGATTFSGTSGTVLMPMNTTSVDITVVPIDDNTINTDRTVTLDLTNPMPFGYQLSGVASEITSTITIKNDDPQANVILGIDAEETNVVAGTFVINFNSALVANTTINYLITGTANASRYVVSGGTNIIGTPTATSAVIAAGSISAEITITPIDDFVINPAETIILILQASTTLPLPDYFVGLTPAATMQIVDNDVVVNCAVVPITPTDTWTGIQKANINYTATTGQALKFNITAMDLGTDFLRIYNGTTVNSANLIAEYTGNIIVPIDFTSISETMTVVVNSTVASSSVTYNIACVPQAPRVNCGAATPTLYNIGSLTTPYTANSRVFRTFQSSSFANGNGQISATFTRFDVEASYDVVKVFNSNDTINNLIGTFHNGQLPISTLTSSNTGGYMTFLLYSDGNVEKSGFEVSMTCGITTVAPTLSKPDSLALETLKTAYPALATLWSSSTPATWEGVTWNQEPVRRVVSISASDKGLVGVLPADFAFIAADDGRMSRLQSLDLSNNAITGTVPTTFGKLKVTHLNLSNNSIDDVPITISDIANLVTLNLSSNSLESADNLLGLENLQYLSELDLSNNEINEDLPVELFNIPNLTNLNLSVNQFTGTLPEEIKDMEFIKVLNLSSNDLTGTLNFNGTVLLFDDQNLLEKLDLSKNQLTGTLPSSMGSSIKFLNLSENKLTGTIDNIANLTSLVELQLQKNEFSGALPLLLHEISFAVTINLSNNKFTGVIPNWTEFVLIRTLDLSFNKLSGQVAAGLNGITTLTNLVLNDNELKDLPILTGLTNMKSLAVYNNRLTFEDLEPNMTVPNFKPALYAPQATINDTIRTTTTIGTRIKMSTNTAGTANFYRWRKGNIPLGNIQVANDSLYIINSVGIDDAGVYSCDVTSTKVVGLTLIRNPIILNVGNPRVNVSDSLALVALYRSADGKNWENSWTLTQPVRTWYGVTLNVDRVVILRLNDNKLDGKIADSLRLLTKLEELNLRKNKLGDSIPLQFGELQSLNRLDLSGNKLIGQIPTTIGSLTKLTYMDLSENSLTGAIPASFTSLNKLENLLLNDNNFNGMPTFAGIATLKKLSVENNRLTFGDLEPNKPLLTNTTLRFSYSPQASINDTRTIQAVFATSLTLTTQTSGSANSYQWTKSNTNIGTNSQVSDYRINSLAYADSGAYSCKVTNTLIPNLTLVRRILTVVVNQPTLLRTDSLALVDLYNSTNGAGWDKKWILTDPMDTWFGVVLDKNIGRVIRLLLSNNKLKGTISTSIGNLTKLKELNIRANPDLTGTIPSTVGNLTELEDLNFRGNKLSGTIPSSLGNLINLKTLALDNNQLSGVIPKELGSLRNLSVLFLNNNKFIGILPSEINNLTLLQELYLNDNELDKLPLLPNLTVLGTLDVKNNKLGFESLESLIRIASFQYSPQIAKDTVSVTIATGQKMDLDPQAGGTQNLYQWRTTAQTAVTTPTASILTIQNIQPQSTGGYICNVKNNLLPNLTIIYLYNVKVVPAIPQITQPLPYCVGNSSVTLTAQGTQAKSTFWTRYDGTKIDTTRNSATLTFTPKQAIDTVFAVTVVRDVQSSARAMIILYIKPILQNNNGVFTVIDNGNPKNKYQWFYFESPISGATSKTFTPEANKFGDYRVNLITEEGCAASSETYKFVNMVTGTEDEMLKNSLKVYPNPTTENLKMELDNEYFSNTTLTISDVLGRVLWEQKMDKNSVFIEQNINVSAWASGTYCLRLQTNKGFATKRFVKQ